MTRGRHSVFNRPPIYIFIWRCEKTAFEMRVLAPDVQEARKRARRIYAAEWQPLFQQEPKQVIEATTIGEFDFCLNVED